MPGVWADPEIRSIVISVSQLPHRAWVQPAPGGQLVISADLPSVPPVIGHIAWRFDERRQAFLEEPALAKPTVVRPSPNLYLDATRVDLDDVGAIQVFISEHGALRIDPTIQVDLGLGLRSDLWNRRKGYFALASNMSGYHCELARSRRRA